MSPSPVVPERVASFDIQTLHVAIVTAAVKALRAGAGLERLDGMAHFPLSAGIPSLRNERKQILDALTSRINEHQKIADGARRNANLAESDEERDAFIADARRASSEIHRFRSELDEFTNRDQDESLPASIESEIDYIAHGLSVLARTEKSHDGTLGDHLRRILQIQRIDHSTGGRLIEVTFRLIIPSDGGVLAFGPIVATVQNDASPKTLDAAVRSEEARVVITGIARAPFGMSPATDRAKTSLDHAVELLTSRGFSRDGARVLIYSGRPSLLAVGANMLWDEPLPEHLESGYHAHVLNTFGDSEFRWHRGGYQIDSGLRQLLVDELLHRGGEASQIDLIDDARFPSRALSEYTKVSSYSEVADWQPVAERIGLWHQQAPRSGRRLRLIGCPHCGGWASLVIHVPEVPDGVLCPSCRRMPSNPDIEFPADYFEVQAC
jgi:hypothetical protein